MEQNPVYQFAFSCFLSIGPVRYRKLLSLKQPMTAKEAYYLNSQDLKRTLGESLTKRFLDFRRVFDPLKQYERIKKAGIKVLCLEDSRYPDLLKNISDPPICLFVKGAIETLSKKTMFAVVGARQPTDYGQRIAYRISSALSGKGFVLVSGLAYGIDALAHRACLDVGGKTVAVLGCGIDLVYPAAHTSLVSNIIKKGGTVLSEFPPRSEIVKGMFVARNRIVSGMSKGVLVIEGRKHSGTLITARYAAEQGRDIFAVPGPIDSDLSNAPNLLIKQGAKLVMSENDILEEYGIENSPAEVKDGKLSQQEKAIIELVKKNALSADEISKASSQPISQLLQLISTLELNNVLVKDSQNRYRIRLN